MPWVIKVWRNVAIGTVDCLLDNQPVALPVHHYQVVTTTVGEVVSGDALA